MLLETMLQGVEYMSDFRMRELLIFFVERVLVSHHNNSYYDKKYNNICLKSPHRYSRIVAKCLNRFESRWRKQSSSPPVVLSAVKMNKKEDLESLNEAARSNLEFSFYGMIGKLVKDPKRRGKKKQSDVPSESIVLAQADTANIVLRSLCSAIECASPKTLDRVVSVVTHLLPRLLQRRDFDRFVGELLFKSVAYVVCFHLTIKLPNKKKTKILALEHRYSLIWRPSNSDTIQWQLVSLLRDIFVAMVLKEPRCAAQQVMLARLFGQNGERKVQEMNARLRALTNSKKQRMVMKNFISETTEASRMRKQREALKVGGMERSILSDVRSTVRLLLCIVFK